MMAIISLMCLGFFFWSIYACSKDKRKWGEEYERRKHILDGISNEISQAACLKEKLKIYLKKRDFDEKECGRHWSSSAPVHLNMEWKEMFKELSKNIASSEEAIRDAQIIKEHFTDAPLQEYYSHLGFDFKFSGKYDDAIVMFEKCSELGESGAWQWAASARNKKRQQECDRRKEKLEQERRERRTRIEKDGNFSEVRTGKEYELFIKRLLKANRMLRRFSTSI